MPTSIVIDCPSLPYMNFVDSSSSKSPASRNFLQVLLFLLPPLNQYLDKEGFQVAIRLGRTWRMALRLAGPQTAEDRSLAGWKAAARKSSAAARKSLTPGKSFAAAEEQWVEV